MCIGYIVVAFLDGPPLRFLKVRIGLRVLSFDHEATYLNYNIITVRDPG